MNNQPILRISHADLDNLMTTLEVNFLELSECLVSPGWRLKLTGGNTTGIHYNLAGTGRMIIGEQPPIDLHPHTLIIAPPGQSYRIEVPAVEPSASTLATVEGHWQASFPGAGAVRKFIAGHGDPKVILLCGHFRASYGSSMDLFSALSSPIVEQFDAVDQLDHKLKSALAELIAQEVGMGAMTAALLKQVLVTLLRRSLSSIDLWVERFSILSDFQIARAFADMVARPSAPHSVQSLAQAAGLSRSVFMARFNCRFGQSPMAALRELRMRQAATLLMTKSQSIDQIAHTVGYSSRSSFLRAFRKAYGHDPSDYRTKVQHSLDQQLTVLD